MGAASVSERDELRAKVASAPKATDIETLIRLMKSWGFVPRWNSANDNVVFWHGVYDVRQSAARPHHGPVLVPYVRKCLRAIDDVETLEAKSDG